MKSNIKLGKLLCCVFLSLVMVFGNASTVFNGSQNKNNENKIYAAIPGYYSDYLRMKKIYLNALVDLTGDIYYTYYQYPNGAKIFYSIDGVDSWLTGITIGYTWIPDCYTYVLSSDCSIAYIKIYGWLDGEYICADYTLYF